MKRMIQLLLCLLLVVPSYVLAAILPQLANEWKPKLIHALSLAIHAPDVAEHGAAVPIAIPEIRVPDPNVYVKELRIYVHNDMAKPVAVFTFGAEAVPTASLRIKLAQTAVVYAYALLSNGNVITGERQIKITVGGCGDGGGGVASSMHYVSPPRVYDYNAEQRESYAVINSNPVKLARQEPVSTFSIDVDTAAYANVRRFISQGIMPPSDAVRVEELINYFDYAYAPPASRERPFAAHIEMARTPWNKSSYLLRIGLKGYEVPVAQLPPANLVFLVDVSGSMHQSNRLPLVQKALMLLVNRLSGRDRVSLVTYAGSTRVVLPATPGDQTETILAAINQLTAGGSTNGGAGIQLAYAEARRGFIPDGVNRVLIATDGDFNVGVTHFQALLDLIKRERESGVTLTTLGFGMGNYNDRLMEQLANNGNGNHAYIDSLNEARKVLGEQLAGTLHTIAKYVKVQIEFNPAWVREYRLIGYENRLLKREDFNNDKIDAGDLGAGHTVTALYEVTLVRDKGLVDELRYQPKERVSTQTHELAWVKLRYKAPQSKESQLLQFPVYTTALKSLDAASEDFRFAAAVAGFGQLLRGGEYTSQYGLNEVIALARGARGADPKGYRSEFLQMVELAQAVKVPKPVAEVSRRF